ncbi:hypothetical protein [Dyadobacter sp. Leaf189]|uniref:hypothetical protein n=1 Tax=Dyadobacter sp. Leaf189 TaxID=1736295 RepID=UPI0006F5FA5C|nr:hypothetical protein [Dyadobacter sp. Leaf189]KQS33868.1 hypothetical protein ASG33_07445 [Dyadobacter sp. Leaf189]
MSIRICQVFLLIMFSNVFVFGQEAVEQSSKANSSKKASEPLDTTALTQQQFDNILNKQFAALITGTSTSVIGSYASFDVKEGTVSFAPNHFYENGNILTARAAGGVSEGALELFNKSKLNTNLSLDFQFHIFGQRNKSVIIDPARKRALQKNQVDADEKYNEDIIYLTEYEACELELKKIRLEEKVASIGKQGAVITSMLSKAREEDKVKLQLSLDSLSLENIKANKELLSVQKDLANNKDPLWRSRKIQDIGNNRAGILKANNFSNLEVRGFSFSWISFGLGIRNDAFRTFDDKQDPASQIVKGNFISQQAFIQFSYYDWSKTGPKNIYFSVRAIVRNTSNLADLDKIEVTDVKEYGQNGVRRYSESTLTAYTGTLKKNIIEVVLNPELYFYPFKKWLLGVHLNPNIQVRGSDDPVSNLESGLIFPFRNKEKDKPTVNAELYYNLLNVFDANAIKHSSSLGVRLAFPIEFKL